MRILKWNINSADLAPLGFFAINILDKSYRFKKTNFNPSNEPAIYALWHGWFYGFLSFRGEERKNVNLLVSNSRDGEFISRVSERLGYSIIRGSKGRGGAKALLGMLNALKNGSSVAYTVDGPRGPAFKVKEGVVKLAQLAQVPIIPLVPASKRVTTFNSWDKYQLPHLFAESAVVFGDPIYVPADLSDDQITEYTIQIENTLADLDKQARNQLVK